MKWKPYPEYRESGVEWLGDLPEHWQAKKGKLLGRLRGSVTPSDDELTEDVDGTPFVKVEDLNTLDQSMRLTNSSARVKITVPVRRLVLFPKRGAAIFTNKVAIAEHPIQFDSNLMGWEIFAHHEIRFVAHALLTRRLDDLADISTVPQINNKHIEPAYFPVPPLLEQKSIAAFLDRETAKIDTLISKQGHLIELLQEKRQALISDAVTKGLNPDAPMKPSGVEWLGEVPAHWDVKPAKLLARIGNGSTPNRDNPLYWDDSGYPWLNSSVVNQESVAQAERFVTPLALRECHLPKITPPAVLIGITGEGRTRGMATTLQMEATVSQHIVYVKPHSSIIETSFIRRVFDMAYQFLRYESEAGGSTKGAITCDLIAKLKIPVPPLAEQALILNHLNSKIGRMDALIAKTETAISLMREHRTALISAAVTGKIDVRNHAHAYPLDELPDA